MTPQLAKEIATVDALVDAIAANTDDRALMRLTLAHLEGFGFFDRATLPMRLREPFGNIVMALKAVSRSDNDLYVSLIRCAFHVTRLVGRVYEDERGGDPE